MAPLPFPSLTGDDDGSRSSQFTSKASQQALANKLVNQESTTGIMSSKTSSSGLLFPKPTSGLMSTATTPLANSLPATSSVSSQFQAKTGTNGNNDLRKGSKPGETKQDNG